MFDGKGKGKKWRKFRRFVDEKIVEAGGLDLSGAEKHAKIARQAAEQKLDDLIEPNDPLLELGSDVLIRLASKLISGFVQNRYERAKSRGRVK